MTTSLCYYNHNLVDTIFNKETEVLKKSLYVHDTYGIVIKTMIEFYLFFIKKNTYLQLEQ